MNIFRLAGDMTHLLSFLARLGAGALSLTASRASLLTHTAHTHTGAVAEDPRHQVVCWCALLPSNTVFRFAPTAGSLGKSAATPLE